VGATALGGIAASFLVGTTNAWIDYAQKSNEARESAAKSRDASEKTLQIVTDLNRTLNPLKDVRATFWVTYPFDDPELARYRQRLDEGIQAILPALKDPDARPNGVYASVRDMSGEVLKITIGKESTLFPDPVKEKWAHTVLGSTSLELLFFKKPVDPTAFNVGIGPTPDIRMSFGAGRSSIDYDVQTKRASLSVFNATTDPKYWRSSGTILSALDLPGAQMVLHTQHFVISFADKRKQIEPQEISLSLDIADRRGWWFTKLKYFETSSGQHRWTYTFPAIFPDLLKELAR
jgi:hypothetical protein